MLAFTMHAEITNVADAHKALSAHLTHDRHHLLLVLESARSSLLLFVQLLLVTLSLLRSFVLHERYVTSETQPASSTRTQCTYHISLSHGRDRFDLINSFLHSPLGFNLYVDARYVSPPRNTHAKY
jgi:hypothetical protein